MESRLWHRSYPEGISPSLDLRPVSVVALLEEAGRRFPDRPALFFSTRTIRYRELLSSVDRMAAAYLALGVGAGDRVAIHLPNLPQTVLAILGAYRIRACPVMTNPLFVGREIEEQWKDAGCAIAVTADYLYADRLHPIRDHLPIRTFLVTEIADGVQPALRGYVRWKLRRMDPPLSAPVPFGERVLSLRRVLGAAEPSRLAGTAGPSLEDVALLQYTGGTTGRAKGAVITHANLSANIQQIGAWFYMLRPGEEVFLGALPLFHIFGISPVLGFPLSIGAAVALVPNPRDTRQVLRTIARRRVTVMPAVPAMFHALTQLPEATPAKLRSVRWCISGSAALPRATQEAFESHTGAVIMEGYGLTETSPVTHCNPVLGRRQNGSIGLPLPETDLRIVDPRDPDRDLPLGEAGELLIKGPQVMRGYWNRPEETERAFHDGWFRSGDLATMDADGYFRIVGREKDMIKSSGYKIYPDEIDDVLHQHPAVLESCTIGLPDEKRGEIVKSFVVLRPGCSATEEDLLAHCHENLAPYKAPRRFEFRTELPKSPMMKLLRRVLREEEMAKRGRGEPA